MNNDHYGTGLMQGRRREEMANGMHCRNAGPEWVSCETRAAWERCIFVLDTSGYLAAGVDIHQAGKEIPIVKQSGSLRGRDPLDFTSK